MFAECDGSENQGNLINFTNRKKINGKRCALTVAAAKFEPFVYFDTSNGFYKGIDYFLVKTIAEQLHFDVNFIEADVNATKLVVIICSE